MRLTLELSERDLTFFRDAMQTARLAVQHADEADIVEAIDDVLNEIKQADPLPDFVARRIPQLETMISMLKDEEWQLPPEERERLLSTFVYFGDPEDIVPDHIPVIGYLDDVIIIELAVMEMQHVRDAYDEFCEFRDGCDKRDGDDQDGASRRDRIVRKRQQLHQRMRHRLEKDRQANRTSVLW
jgi:uncharacterized membrane protein YkvA (DUF1232 family)